MLSPTGVILRIWTSQENQEWDCVVTCLVVKKMAEKSSEDVCVLLSLETNGVRNWLLNFSGQKEALALAISQGAISV